MGCNGLREPTEGAKAPVGIPSLQGGEDVKSERSLVRVKVRGPFFINHLHWLNFENTNSKI
jgi:hypothetical protein